MLQYLYVFFASFLVDLLPFFGPPAWTVMVFFQMRFGLNIWLVIVLGVLGSTLGRYVLTLYIPWLSRKVIKAEKNEDIEYIGAKLGNVGWQVQLFVLLYTLMPLPSTPLFTAAGLAHIKPIRVIPAFFIGKFISDMAMVVTGDYVASNAVSITSGIFSWQSIAGTALGIIIIFMFVFIDWRLLLQHKKFRLNFHVWK